MQRRRILTLATAGTAAIAVMLTACGGSSGGSSSSGAAKSGGSITVYNCKPQNALLPGNTNETCGDHRPAGRLPRPGPLQPGRQQARRWRWPESITPSDSSTQFDVKLKPGNTFQDGSPVNSDSFINAWNWAAYAPNGAVNNTFFAAIVGLRRPQPGAAEGLDPGPDADHEDHVRSEEGQRHRVHDHARRRRSRSSRSRSATAASSRCLRRSSPTRPPSARSRSATVR